MLKSFNYTRYLTHLPFSVWNLTMICVVLSCKRIKDWVTKTAFLGKENLAILLFSKENKNSTKDKIVQQLPLKLSFRWAMKTLYPLELQNPCFTVMWGLFWMAKWLILSAESGFSLSAGSRLKNRLLRILSRLLFREREEGLKMKAWNHWMPWKNWKFYSR